MTRWLAVLCLTLCMFWTLWTISACGKGDSGPSCAVVVDHLQDVIKQGMTGHGGMELTNRKRMIDQCELRAFSAAVRKCLLAVKDMQGMALCRQQAGEGPAEAPRTFRPGPPAMPGSGGSAATGSAGSATTGSAGSAATGSGATGSAAAR